MIVRYAALVIVLGFSLLFLIKGCSSNRFVTTRYAISQDTRWEGMQLMKKDSSLSGFNRDLLSVIAKEQGIEFQLKAFPNTDLLLNLEKHQVDGVLSSFTPELLDRKQFLVSDPYFFFGPVLVIPIVPLEEWNSKTQKIIAIPQHSRLLTTLEKDSTIQLKFYQQLLTALSDLREGKIDGALFPAIPSYTYVKAFYPNELKISTPPLTQEGIRLITLNNVQGQALIQSFNTGLSALKESGEYDELLDHWGLKMTLPTPEN